MRALIGALVYAVVKADGYGHGAIEVALAPRARGRRAGFAVSLVEEGVALRDAGIEAPVLVLGPSQHGGEDEMVAAWLTPVISCDEELAAFAAVARRRGGLRRAPQGGHGDGPARRAARERGRAAREAAAAGVRLVGLMTHLACADIEDPADPASMTARSWGGSPRRSARWLRRAPLRVRHAPTAPRR